MEKIFQSKENKNMTRKRILTSALAVICVAVVCLINKDFVAAILVFYLLIGLAFYESMIRDYQRMLITSADLTDQALAGWKDSNQMLQKMASENKKIKEEEKGLIKSPFQVKKL